MDTLSYISHATNTHAYFTPQGLYDKEGAAAMWARFRYHRPVPAQWEGTRTQRTHARTQIQTNTVYVHTLSPRPVGGYAHTRALTRAHRLSFLLPLPARVCLNPPPPP